MKPLIATMLISLSGLGSGNTLVAPGKAGSDVGNYRPATHGRSVQLKAVQPTTTDWCTCSMSIEEKIFLQQYNIE